jgi:cytochrome P450/NADPH-cytochrome P450 reductase
MGDSLNHDIPGPTPKPIVGNLPDIDLNKPLQSFMALAREYGPIFRLQVQGRTTILCSSQELVDELCDERRFDKKIQGTLREVRALAGDGLFTAETQEHNWGVAHRILMPVFGPASLRNMFPQMLDIAEQMLLKWERQGPAQRIDVVDDMTRLTLDTIALCAFNYRFNSFYQKDMHPFIGAMVRALTESGARSRRLPLQNRLMLITRQQYEEDVRLMHQVADEVIAESKKHSEAADTRDILSIMLNAKDPQTGEGLSDENIRYQMVTFLIAGHETTSGLLSFTLYALLRHPEVMERARAEVERVLGSDEPRFEHLRHLTYLDQILKESLRLWPTAPGFTVCPYGEETIIGSKYRVRRDQTLFILLPMLHRDPRVWGADAEEFDPEHFAFERAEKLPPNAWKPFGNGQRSCIGRPFALQEATLVLAMMLQRFDLTAADPDYQLEIKEALTLKPYDLFVRAKRRDVHITRAAQPSTAGTRPSAAPASQGRPQASNGIPIRVLFGSNAGSSEQFAQSIVNDAGAQGYVPTIGPLDSAAGHLPREGAVVIVTASYEGKPPDNARQFIAWTEGLTAGSLRGVKYAVFGCGNRDWARTYQTVPKFIDEKLAEAGAERLVERGEANARGDFFGDFDRWYDGFWQRIGAAFGQEARELAPMPLLELAFVEPTREPLLRQNDLQLGTVVVNRELVDMSAPNARSKRHIEIALPKGQQYRTGDYLAVLPLNPPDNIDRALRRFELSYDSQVVIHSIPGVRTFFPVDRPVMVGELLRSFVELAQPATRKQVEHLADTTPCPPEKKQLQALASDDAAYTKAVLNKRVSVLDLLERYQSCSLSFAAFLQMVSSLKPRQYSISSSPLWSADHCALTVAIVDAPALSGQGRYYGVASNYLGQARPGTKIAVTVKPSSAAFQPPESLATPIVMICAGTGIAPFRGFLQDRALRAEQAQGHKVGRALLFFGCDLPDVDFLYKDELQQWEQQDLLSVRPAFTFAPDLGGKFVQDRLWRDRADVVKLFKEGAVVYLCGDGQRMAPAVHDICVRIYEEATGSSREDAEQWMTEMELTHGRYVADVFA